MIIAVLGTGSVGRTLAARLVSLGNEVMIGTRSVKEKLASTTGDTSGNPPFSKWLSENSKVSLGTFEQAAVYGEIVINATRGEQSISALKLAGDRNLAGKILIDISNPLDFSKGMPPCLIPELQNTNSLGEEIQKTFPLSKVVKTLNTMWCGLMVNPGLIGKGDHINFIAGNDSDAKEEVKIILVSFGWKKENIFDLGDITGARASESFLNIWLRIMGNLQTPSFNFRLVR